MEEEARGAPRRPFVVAVAGLKNSGKTTVAGALISALSARGLQVAAIKTSHLPRLDLDFANRDSRQLYDAGAVCVVAQGQEETLVVRRHDRRASIAELLGVLPADTDCVVIEGGVPAQADVVLLCLRTLQDLEETLAVRQVPRRLVRALTGLAAARPKHGASPGAAFPAPESATHGSTFGLPLIDALAPGGSEALARLVLPAGDSPGTPLG